MNSKKQYTGYSVAVYDTEQGKKFYLSYNGHIKMAISPEKVKSVLSFIMEENARKQAREKNRVDAATIKNRFPHLYFLMVEDCIPSVSRLTLKECRALYGDYYRYCVKKGRKACNAAKRKKTQAIYANRAHYMRNIRTIFQNRHNVDNARARIATMINKIREYNTALSKL